MIRDKIMLQYIHFDLTLKTIKQKKSTWRERILSVGSVITLLQSCQSLLSTPDEVWAGGQLITNTHPHTHTHTHTRSYTHIAYKVFT